MTKIVAIYMVVGIIISGRFAAWEKQHCQPPHASLADDVVIILAWGLLIPSAVVYKLSGGESDEACK